MKNSIIKSLIVVTLFFQFQISSGQIKGNGKFITQEITVTNFEKIHINFPVLFEVNARADFSLVITTDENILPRIVIKNESNQLSILQDEWIQPSKTVRVEIGMQGLKKLEMEGYGDGFVYNLDEKYLKVINTVGKLRLEGKVETLNFELETGKLNAEKLLANEVNGKINSHGEALVNATETLTAQIVEQGKLVYVQKPNILDLDLGNKGEAISLADNETEKVKMTPVKYVKVKLKNNRFERIHTYVKGPKNKNFSYGMPFNPKQTRVENYPVGTEIYRVGLLGRRTLLVTVKEADAGQIVKLFGDK